MKTLIPYIIACFLTAVIVWQIKPTKDKPIEPVGEIEIIPEPDIFIEDTGKIEYVVLDSVIIDSLKTLGRLEFLRTFVPEIDTVRDTVKFTNTDTIYIKNDSLIHASFDTTFEDTSYLSIELWLNPKSLIHLWNIRYMGRKSYQQTITRTVEHKWTFETGVLAGYLGNQEYVVGVCGSLFYKNVGGMVYVNNQGFQFGILRRWQK